MIRKGGSHAEGDDEGGVGDAFRICAQVAPGGIDGLGGGAARSVLELEELAFQ
jgi:hypothetical protein